MVDSDFDEDDFFEEGDIGNLCECIISWKLLNVGGIWINCLYVYRNCCRWGKNCVLVFKNRLSDFDSLCRYLLF